MCVCVCVCVCVLCSLLLSELRPEPLGAHQEPHPPGGALNSSDEGGGETPPIGIGVEGVVLRQARP